MDRVKELETEILLLRKQVLTETIRRLSLEHQYAQATLTMVTLRSPMIEAEMDQAQKNLAALAKEQESGTPRN